MKRFLLFLIPIILCHCNAKDDLLIKPNRVSNLVIGTPKNEVFEELNKYRIEELKDVIKDNWNSYYNVYMGKNLIYSLKFYSNDLNAIQVHSNKYFTSKAVRIGSTAQEVINKGHRIWALSKLETVLRAQIEEDNMYLNFEKRITKNGEIGKYALLKSVTVGYPFEVREEQLKYKEKDIVYGQMEDRLFFSKLFNLKYEVPEKWLIKTHNSNISNVEELLYFTDPDNTKSFLIIAQKLKNPEIKTGYDYLTQNNGAFISMEQVSKSSITIANKPFYYAKFQMNINDKQQTQLMWATIQDNYAILITAKFDEKESENVMKKLINNLEVNN